jgi:DNA-binding beta-propeller fold protein YncE
MKHGGPFILLAAAFFLFSPGAAAQETGAFDTPDRDSLYAREEFRVGVQAYNRYAFNEAILSFERALSFRPGEPLILDWLGRSYYRSGLEDAALRQWQSALERYRENQTGDSLLLSSRVETIRNRRSLYPLPDPESRYVESGHFPGRYDNTTAFRQPSAVVPLEDGSAWVVAYGSNEILRIDVNGIIRQRHRGPLNGFDRPYDMVRGPGGRLYLSEYRGGRISVLSPDGEWLFYIGAKGLGEGQLLGPQNLTIDEEGYLYVVDYGNRRIVKFDPGGAFILSFGAETGDFPGLVSPTGIAAGEGRIFVLDNASRRIYGFDRNGAYRGVLIGEGLISPEGLRFFPGGGLLTVDTNRFLLIDPDAAIIRELGAAGNSTARILNTGVDQNGNILAAAFSSDEVLIMTPLDDMAAGLFVQIDRVSAENFPLVTVELRVQDRRRRPIVGLEGRNFLLSEGGRAATEQNFLSAAYRSDTADITVLVERSPRTMAMAEDLQAALRDIRASSARIVSLISAGEQPFREQTEVSLAAGEASHSPRWRFDLGLRLAAADLLGGAKKRAVVFVGSGSLGDLAFEQYGLSELAAYLANNDIVFYAVILGANPSGREIRYLCEQTGGSALALYRPEGIKPILDGLKQSPSGSYTLNYRSSLPTDFGRAYLPVEAEVYLLDRSGRDSTGYFPPME